MTKRKLLSYLVMLSCVIQTDWFVRYMNMPDATRRLPIVLTVFLLFRIIVDVATDYIHIVKKDKVIIFTLNIFIIMLFHLLFSTIYGNQSFVLGIYSNRYFLTGIALVFATHYYLKNLSFDKVITYIVIIALVQIPISILQYIVTGGGMEGSLDMVTGTFSGYSDLVAFQTIAIGILIAEKQSGRNILHKNGYFLAILCIIPLLISNSKTAIIFPVIMILFQFTRRVKGRRLSSQFGQKIIIILLMIITVLMFYRFFWYNKRDLTRYSDKDYITNYYMREAGETTVRMGRLRSIIVSFETIKNDFVTIVIGNGPGSAQLATLLNKQGKYYQEFGEFAGLGRTQISLVLVEYGFIGFLVVFLVIVKVRNFSKVLTITEMQKWRNLFEAIILIMVIMSWYSLTFTTYTYCGVLGVVIGLIGARRFERSR